MRAVTPITLTNSQSQASPSNFQQLIQTTLLYPNGVRFWSPTDGYLPAWLESISSSNSANIWVKIPSSIPANGTYQLYMIQDSTIPMDGVYWGEAPQLSSTYAQYDNGANVFPYYQRWGGLSSLPSGWSSISGTVLTFADTYTEVQPSPTVNGWYGIYLNPLPQSFLAPTVWTLYGNLYSVKYAIGLLVGTATGYNNNGGYVIDDVSSSGLPPPEIYFFNPPNFIATGYTDSNNNKLYSMQLNSPTSVQIFVNYSQIYSNPSAVSQNVSYFVIAPTNSSNYGPTGPAYIYWLRTTAYPPNGVMPSAYFGAYQYSGELITVTVP